LGSLAAIKRVAISQYFSGDFCRNAWTTATPLAAKSFSIARKTFALSLSRKLGS